MSAASAEPVVVVAYDPAWPERFARERDALARVFGSEATIEHVGSTAVPGLDAKPVVDILLGVAALDRVERRIPELAALGWEHRPELEAELPERRFFRKPPTGPRECHLHAAERGGAFWREHLAFRDRLRADPATARAYAELKRRLAARHREDRDAYTRAKADFVRAALRERPA